MTRVVIHFLDDSSLVVVGELTRVDGYPGQYCRGTTKCRLLAQPTSNLITISEVSWMMIARGAAQDSGNGGPLGAVDSTSDH